MQNYSPPLPPSHPLFLCPCLCPLIVRMRSGEVKWIENQLAECFCLFSWCPIYPKSFEPQRSSVNGFTVGDHGTAWSIQRHHQGLRTGAVTLYKILTLTFSPSQKHIPSPSLSPCTFREGCPTHSAVLAIKGMSMFIWHTLSQFWLNSRTMRQMYCTVARDQTDLECTHCVSRVAKKILSACSREGKDNICNTSKERMTICLKVWR